MYIDGSIDSVRVGVTACRANDDVGIVQTNVIVAEQFHEFGSKFFVDVGNEDFEWHTSKNIVIRNVQCLVIFASGRSQWPPVKCLSTGYRTPIQCVGRTLRSPNKAWSACTVELGMVPAGRLLSGSTNGV